jgi:hypothetical protein
MSGKNKVGLGYIDVPKDYATLKIEEKDALCNRIIDKLLFAIDKELPTYMNRITFLDEILESSLESNEQEENYEVCMVIKDIINKLNED